MNAVAATSKGMKFLVAVVAVNFLLTAWVLWNQESMRVRNLYYFVFKHPAPVNAYDHQRGDPKARVVLIEYGDFQCPYCSAFHKTLTGLQKSDGFLWVFRNYPLGFHDHAQILAESAECAGQQGEFWQMADTLYAEPPAHPDVDSLTALAGKLGLDGSKFWDCMGRPATKALVQRQTDVGDGLGIYGTPTFFINGVRFYGAMPADKLDTLLKSVGS